MQESITKASHLIEALPYIRRFNGKIVVVKCGGAAMTKPAHMQQIMQDLTLLHFCGIRPILVHGGGPEISAWCDKLQLPIQFAHGQRVTDTATMEVVQMVLLGKTNRALVSTLNQLGVNAVGISGQDSAFITVKPAQAELGYVGEIIKLDPQLIMTLLSARFFPVVAPIGVDAQGQAYNINADFAASALAVALKAEKLVILSDVNGFYEDAKDPNTRINHTTKENVKQWLAESSISGGMIPKLQACVSALEQEVVSCHLLDGNMPHSLLLEIFTDNGVGTLIQ